MQKSHESQLRQTVRTLQIIVLALAAGVITFGVIALAVRGGEPVDSPIITYVMAGFAALLVVARILVPHVFVSQQRRLIARGDVTASASSQTLVGPEGVLSSIYMQRTIIANALLEGAAFSNLVAYLVEGQLISLFISAGLVMGILADLPTLGRVQSWIAHQLRLADEEQAMRRTRDP